MPRLPKTLNSDEKKFLLAVERGDIATVRRFLKKTIKFLLNLNRITGRFELLSLIYCLECFKRQFETTQLTSTVWIPWDEVRC